VLASSFEKSVGVKARRRYKIAVLNNVTHNGSLVTSRLVVTMFIGEGIQPLATNFVLSLSESNESVKMEPSRITVILTGDDGIVKRRYAGDAIQNDLRVSFTLRPSTKKKLGLHSELNPGGFRENHML